MAEYVDEFGKSSLVGVARLVREHSGSSAEIAFVLSDKYQCKGLGSYLLQQSISVARQEGLSSLHAVVLYENSEMRNLFKRAGFSFSEPEAGIVSARLELRQDDALA